MASEDPDDFGPPKKKSRTVPWDGRIHRYFMENPPDPDGEDRFTERESSEEIGPHMIPVGGHINHPHFHHFAVNEEMLPNFAPPFGWDDLVGHHAAPAIPLGMGLGQDVHLDPHNPWNQWGWHLNIPPPAEWFQHHALPDHNEEELEMQELMQENDMWHHLEHNPAPNSDDFQ